MTEKTNLLKGAKLIRSAFDLNEEQFYLFVRLGMPVCKINGTWYGHYKTIDAWFQGITDPRHTKKKRIDIDSTNT